MSNIQEYFHAISAFNSLVLCFLLFVSGSKHPASNVLGLWSVGLAYFAINPLILLNSDSTLLLFAAIGGQFIPASFGALLYLYVRSLVTSHALRRSDALYFVPFIVCSLLVIYVLLSGANLAETAPSELPKKYSVLLQSAQFILYAQAFIFAALSIRLVYRFRRQAADHFTHFNPNIFWQLSMIIAINVMVWTFHLLVLVFTYWHELSLMSDVLLVCFVTALSVFQLTNPQYFKIHSESHKHCESLMEETESGELSYTQREQFYDHLTHYMETEKPYLDSNLNLTTLAAHMDMSRHYLSEVINRMAGHNFYQLINTYRIEHFKALLREQPTGTLLDLAFASGFASKSTFNAVFKQINGCTPSQYKKALPENSN